MALSDDTKEILAKKAFVHVATLMPDGSPQVSPVWAEVDGENIVFNTAEGRVKPTNLRRDPRIALSATDPDADYHAIHIRGKVVEITEEGADDHINKLAKKYMDVDEYPFRQDGEVRLRVVVEPEREMVLG